MLFHEIYSTYFQTVAKILAEAVEHPLTNGEINAIIQDYAFEESTLNIPESLGMTHWQLLKEDGTTILRKKPTMPLTILQKRWINAIREYVCLRTGQSYSQMSNHYFFQKIFMYLTSIQMAIRMRIQNIFGTFG